MMVIGRNTSRFQSYRGLTLVECLLAMTILPMAVVAVSYAIVAGQSQATEALRQTRASILAEALMEEILALPYEDPDGPSGLGPEAGESSRSNFDNMDDFHGFSEAAGSLYDGTGTSYPMPMQRSSRSVSCSLTSKTVSGLSFTTNGLEVTVTVSDSSGPIISVSRFAVEPPSS